MSSRLNLGSLSNNTPGNNGNNPNNNNNYGANMSPDSSPPPTTTTIPGQTKKFVLKPYKPALILDQAKAVELWLKLQNAIGRIHSQEASQLSFEELYR